MKKTLGLVAGVLLGTVSTVALAEPTTGLYGTVAAGPSFYEDITPNAESGSLGAVPTTTTFKTGFRTTAAARLGLGQRHPDGSGIRLFSGGCGSRLPVQ
ncbi:MAG: hypothetical protein WDN69_02325 [Aliidongia sp.]